MIHIDASNLRNHDDGLRQVEWLDANGRGGYSSSTLANCHTRKYHGLLVANLESPPGRYVLLSKLDDSVLSSGAEIHLTQHCYAGALIPDSLHHLTDYIFDKCPQFVYRWDGHEVRKSIMMLWTRDAVMIRYDIILCPQPGLLKIKPLVAYRDYHQLSAENSYIRQTAAKMPDGPAFNPYDGMPPLRMTANADHRFQPYPCWYKSFHYTREKERGFKAEEDLFCYGVFEIPVQQGLTIIISASTEPIEKGRLQACWDTELDRRSRTEYEDRSAACSLAANDEDGQNIDNLLTAARQFFIETPSGRPAVVAGYHWFSDWGRDTLISLPGLAFCRNCFVEGLAILNMMARHEKHGLLPNYFAEDESATAYNSVDSSLWFFWAVQQLLFYSKSLLPIKGTIWTAMKNIVKKFTSGTLHNIFMDEKTGLLHAGNAKMQLTWMDAMANGEPVTPRAGYAVDINALWYNALCLMQELSGSFEDNEIDVTDVIHQFPEFFRKTFWLEEEEYLADCISEAGLDRSIRPNQILSVSLPYSPLDHSQSLGVVNTVKNHLLTPAGLRTLSPADEKYRGSYEGGVVERDTAYHQGTVWPWLLGHFGEAFFKTAEDKTAARLYLLDIMRDFLRGHLKTAGCGSISEIFDGDPPHRPNGCISQAWSVAEIIRLYSLMKH